MDEPNTLDDVDTALNWLLRAVGVVPTGDRQADLELAAQATMRARELNSRAGGLVLAELRERGSSWSELQTLLGGKAKVSIRTLGRWAEPPSP